MGGIVGGVLGLLLIDAPILYVLLRHRRLASVAQAGPDSGQEPLSAEGTISRSGTPGPYGRPATLKERMMSPTDSVVYVRICMFYLAFALGLTKARPFVSRIPFCRTQTTRAHSRRRWG